MDAISPWEQNIHRNEPQGSGYNQDTSGLVYELVSLSLYLLSGITLWS